MSRRQPTAEVEPVLVRLRIRYAKRGPLRFASHRDVARALERAVRRAGIPVAHSAAFTPHPKISYLGAAPTGAASEAEYAELGLKQAADPQWVRQVLDGCLPPGLDILECVPADGSVFADTLQASGWRIEWPGVDREVATDAAHRFLAQPRVEVERMMKTGKKIVDVRGAVVSLQAGDGGDCAILDLVVRQSIPAVRPDDVIAALRAVADLAPTEPSKATRYAQGLLDSSGCIVDPIAAGGATVSLEA